MTPRAETPDDEPEVEEPPNSTVDDWFGQNVARDQDVADRALDEADGDMEEAEERFDAEADGKDRFQRGHDRPPDAR